MHVLYNALDGCVQRKDYMVIRELLPPKKEFVLSIRMSEKQIELYTMYLKHAGMDAASVTERVKRGMVFADFQNLSRVWTHPWALKLNEARLILQEARAAERAFVAADDESEDAASVATESDDFPAGQVARSADDDDEDNGSDDLVTKVGVSGGGVNAKQPMVRWWKDQVGPECEFNMEMSGKLVILEMILRMCEQKGDKL